MRNLLNPKWIFIINTLPIGVLFFILFGQFTIIKSLLDEEGVQLWKSFGLTLGILGFLNFIYAAYLTFKKKNVSIVYGVVALLSYIPFIYLYTYHSNEIIPFDIPRWMLPGNAILYVGTFLMPTLIYSLFILVVHFTSGNKEYKAWVNFLIAIGVPIAGYLFSQTILPLWQRFEEGFNVHLFLIIIVVSTLVFLFFLIRSIFIIATKKSIIWQEYKLMWELPIAIILPLLGLLVNNGYLFPSFILSTSGIFGDFNNHWFYILAILNGIFICLPDIDKKIYRLFLFILRSLTFSYTFYFFLVFLPFLPLSLVAIIAIGTGFLMLTPLILFIFHISKLSKDFAFLKLIISKKILVGISFLSFLIIPASITITYLNDRNTLNETLDYVYNSNYSKHYNINERSLQKTLNVIKHHKDRNRDMIFEGQIPYLSSFFNWLVLDNLTLSDTKINTIEGIFFGNYSFELLPEDIQSDSILITNISTNSVYDKTQNAWKTWVDLEITNKSKNTWFSEYATILNLPEGCWISDYYLYVGDRKEFGILAEKKSAMWVFSQIRNENRDPGILYYLTGNKVAFRIFPFSKDEVRKTGIQFLHKEPIKLTIDGNNIELGNVEQTISENVETKNVVYVSAKQKKSLKVVQRKPYFHFLVDVSKYKNKYCQEFINRIEQVNEKYKPLLENAQISFVNSYVNTFQFDSSWKKNYQSQNFQGGFYLDRAIRTTLFNSYNKKSYPVIVVVTDDIKNAIVDKDFSDFKFTFPENNLFFNLDINGVLQPHSFIANPIEQLSEIDSYSFSQPVLEYVLSDHSITYLPNNDEPSIILKNDIFEISESEMKERNWNSVLLLQGKYISQVLHPETSNKEWLHLVKYSFMSKVMTPETSYLVVENEAQKAILKKKQEQVLSGNKSLDPDEDTQRMSEPSLFILMILFGLIFWYRQKRKQQLRIIRSNNHKNS